MIYGPKIKAEARRLYVQDGLSPRRIAEELSGPSWQTIDNWRRKKDRNGKTWIDYREEEMLRQYEAVSPENLARKILQRIYDLLGNYTDKTPDDLAKLTATMKKIVDPKYQIHIMFSMLTDEVKFAKKYYPKIVDDKFLSMIRDFKNFLRGRLDD